MTIEKEFAARRAMIEAAAQRAAKSGALRSKIFAPFKWFFEKTGRFWSNMLSYAVGQTVSTILTPLFRGLQYETNTKVQNEIYDISMLVNLRIRGIMKHEDYLKYMTMFSLDKTKAEDMLNGSYALLSAGDIQTMYNRGLLNEEECKKRLAEMGYKETEANEVLKLAGYIPSVADFVTFAVREVFSPETAKLYGQFEDYPANFEANAKLSGLNPEYAKYYWAAHWDLPSYSQGIEMYHRGIIDFDGLKGLLKALDVMPYWREKMITLAETPFTRVDVRRMYKLGVMDVMEITKAYMDLGYSQDKASKLAQFAVFEATEGTKDLSKSEVIACYENGLLTRGDAGNTIQEMGFSKEEAELLLQTNDIKRNRQFTTQFIGALKKEYLAYRLTEDDARIYLNKLNIAAAAIDELILTWTLDLQPKTAKPTKAEILKWWNAGLLTTAGTVDELRALGYPDKYIELYMYKSKETGAGITETETGV